MAEDRIVQYESSNIHFTEVMKQKDKYLKTSRKILAEDRIVQYESSNIHFTEVMTMTNMNFFLIVQMSRSKDFVTTEKSYDKKYSC